MPSTQTLVIDTTRPSLPTITSDDLTNFPSPTLSGTAEDVDVVTVKVGGASFEVSVVDGVWTLDLAQAQPTVGVLALDRNGPNSVEVIAVDAAGNASQADPHTLVIDTTPPSVPTITSGDLTKLSAPVITGTADDGSVVTVSVGGAVYEVTPSGGNWSLDLAIAQPVSGTLALNFNGSNPINVVSTDEAGNPSDPGTQTLIIDTTPPSVPTITSAELTPLAEPVIEGTADDGTLVTVSVGNALYEVTPAGGTWRLDLATAQPVSGTLVLNQNGSNPITAVSTDEAGNESDAGAQTLVIDTTPPSTPVINSPTTTHLVTPVIEGLADGAAEVTVSVGGATYVVTVTNGAWSLDLATATPTSGALAIDPVGSYPISAVAADKAGNTSDAGEQTLLVDPDYAVPPSITSADSVEGIQQKFADYFGRSAVVDATGMSSEQWNEVADVIGRVGNGKITGELVLAADVNAQDALALLGKYSGTQATLDASVHSPETVLTLVNNSKVQTLSMLTFALTDSVLPDLAQILTKAPDAQVDVTGASAANLMALADLSTPATEFSLTGTVSIPAGIAVDDIVSLLGRYAGTTAKVDVLGMNTAALQELLPVFSKISGTGLQNLTIVMGDQDMTDGLVNALLGRADGAKVDVTGATTGMLRSLGNTPDKVADGGITGIVVISQDLNLNQQQNLLGNKLGSTATISANVTNLDVPALKALALRSDQLVDDVIGGRMHLNSQLSATEIGVLIEHFGGTAISAHATGMNASAVANMAAGFDLFFPSGITGVLAMPGSLPFNQAQGLLSKYAGTEATITAPTYSLSELAQLAVSTGVQRIASPVLNITTLDAGANQQVSDILAKSQNATIDNTIGNPDILPAILANLSHIAASGIEAWGSGQIALNNQTLDPDNIGTFVGKLAADLKLAVNAAQMDADQIVALFGQGSKVATLTNLAVPAGVFAQISANAIDALFMLQIGIHADLTGANLSHIAKVAQFSNHLANNGLTGSFLLDHTLSSGNLSDLLSKTAVAANVTVDTTLMDDAQVQAVLDHQDKTDSIIGLSVGANADVLQDTDALASLLNKATNLSLDLHQASPDVIDVVLDNLGSFANGGLYNAKLTLDAAQWQALDVAQLSAKLTIDGTARVDGSAANEVLDFQQMSKHYTVDAGAGADRILLGSSNGTVELGGRTDNKSAAFSSTDTSPINMDRLEGVHNGIKLKLSTEMSAYVDGVALSASTTISPLWASAGQNLEWTMQDFYQLASVMGDGISGSTDAQLNMRGIHYSKDGINQTYIFINDGVAGIDENDFVVHVIGGGTMLLTF